MGFRAGTGRLANADALTFHLESSAQWQTQADSVTQVCRWQHNREVLFLENFGLSSKVL